MTLRVALDGLGGISRQIVVAASSGGFSDLFEIVRIDDSAGVDAVQRRLERDSSYGRLPHKIERDASDVLRFGDHQIQVGSGNVSDWDAEGVDIVVVDGRGADAEARITNHRERAAKKVVVAGGQAPGGKTIVFGLNESSYHPDNDSVVGTGSAVLNAVALPAAVIQQHFAIARGAFTVIHPIVAGQTVQDRAGVPNLASRSASHLIPDIADQTHLELGTVEPILGSKFFGSVVHAPVTPVGWVTLSAETERRLELTDAVDAFNDAAGSDQFAGLLGLTSEALVSGDLSGDSHSVTLISSEISMVGRAFLSVRGWFDAEWAMACRTTDLLALICEAGVPGTA